MHAREKFVSWKSPLGPGERGWHIVDKRHVRTQRSASDSQRSVHDRKRSICEVEKAPHAKP
jgi:hypothetical protein